MPNRLIESLKSSFQWYKVSLPPTLLSTTGMLDRCWKVVGLGDWTSSYMEEKKAEVKAHFHFSSFAVWLIGCSVA